MKLTNDDINKITSHVDGFVTINDKEYYVKGAIDEGLQLIANDIAKYLGINCVTDHFIKTKDDAYYLSLSLNNFGTFKSGKELEFSSNSLYDIWIFLEKKYPKYSIHLVNELVKVFLYDVFLLNGDRNLGNIGILESNDDVSLYILDNEFIFSTFDVDLLPKLYYDERLKKYVFKDYLRKDIPLSIERNIESLEYFIATSSNEYGLLVRDFYLKLTPEYITSVFKRFENEGIVINEAEKKYYFVLYKMSYDLIGNLLKERGLLDGQRISKN